MTKKSRSKKSELLSGKALSLSRFEEKGHLNILPSVNVAKCFAQQFLNKALLILSFLAKSLMIPESVQP